jgi:hypothetical protein
MKQQVELHAQKLLSNDASEFIDAAMCLRKVRTHTGPHPSARMRFARLLQELLAYKRGELVQNVLHKFLMLSYQGVTVDATRDLELSYASCTVLAILTESRVVAQFCVKEQEAMHKLGRSLLYVMIGLHVQAVDAGMQHPTGHDPDSEALSGGVSFFLESCLKTFANFFRASNAFFLSLQQLNALFPVLERLLSDGFLSILRLEEVSALRPCFFRLMDAFVLFEDTQGWAFDKGLLRIHAALARTSPQSLDNAFKSVDPASGLTVDESEEQRKQVLASNSQKLLEMDRIIRDPNDPQKARGIKARLVEQHKLQSHARMREEQDNPAVKLPSDLIEALEASPAHPDYRKSSKRLAEWYTGGFEAPMVCSWEHCEAGTNVEASRTFSKCANCSLAFYCR